MKHNNVRLMVLQQIIMILLCDFYLLVSDQQLCPCCHPVIVHLLVLANVGIVVLSLQE